MRKRDIAVCVLAGAIFFTFTEWPERLHPEYRKITAFSEVQRQLFEKRLASTVPTQTRIYVRDLLDFEWDKVCYIYEYSSPRTVLAKTNALNKDFGILDLFPDFNEGEEGFVFVNDERIVAIVKGWRYNIDRGIYPCADRSKARLIAIPLAAWHDAKLRKAYDLSPTLANLKIFGTCKNKKDCKYVFTGAQHELSRY